MTRDTLASSAIDNCLPCSHVEVCTTWQHNETLLINFALGIIIFLYFLLRALGTEDFLKFIFELETVRLR